MKSINVSILLLIVLVFITGCSNSKLITKDIEITGNIKGNLCEQPVKCIPFVRIEPPSLFGLDLEFDDMEVVKPYINQNKTVKIKGDIISMVDVVSCAGRMDQISDPNCEAFANLKYYTAKRYIKVESIELIN